jgi:hypothetical protein
MLAQARRKSDVGQREACTAALPALDVAGAVTRAQRMSCRQFPSNRRYDRFLCLCPGLGLGAVQPQKPAQSV